MLEPEVETRPWDEQLALDDARYREQLAYLLERSAFYREKLGAAGVDAAPRPAGWTTIARLPLTEKHELRATVTPREPVRRRTSAPTRGEIVRIYSTSGTTGTPSYIPLTAGDLDNWVTGSARSYAASGVAAGQRIVSTYNAGPFVAGAALAAVRPHRPLPHPGRHRQHRAAAARRSSCCGPRRRCSRRRTPPTCSSGRPSAASTSRASSVERVLVAGEPGGGEPAFRAQLEEGWGAKVTEAMGIGDIGVSLWGECEEQDGHAPRRARLRPRGADRPRDGRRARARRTARRASSC